MNDNSNPDAVVQVQTRDDFLTAKLEEGLNVDQAIYETDNLPGFTTRRRRVAGSDSSTPTTMTADGVEVAVKPEAEAPQDDHQGSLDHVGAAEFEPEPTPQPEAPPPPQRADASQYQRWLSETMQQAEAQHRAWRQGQGWQPSAIHNDWVQQFRPAVQRDAWGAIAQDQQARYEREYVGWAHDQMSEGVRRRVWGDDYKRTFNSLQEFDQARLAAEKAEARAQGYREAQRGRTGLRSGNEINGAAVGGSKYYSEMTSEERSRLSPDERDAAVQREVQAKRGRR